MPAGDISCRHPRYHLAHRTKEPAHDERVTRPAHRDATRAILPKLEPGIGRAARKGVLVRAFLGCEHVEA